MKNLRLLPLLCLFCPLFGAAQEYSIKDPDAGAKVFKDWATQCKTASQTNVEICYSSQTIMVKNQDKNIKILYIAIGHVPEADKPVLRFTTPLGTLLPEGMRLKIDAGEESRIPFIFCDRIGCHIEIPAPETFVASIKKGNKMNVRFFDIAGRSIDIPVSLSGFTGAYNALKK